MKNGNSNNIANNGNDMDSENRNYNISDSDSENNSMVTNSVVEWVNG